MFVWNDKNKRKIFWWQISEKLPLRGCLNPDAGSYVVSFVSLATGVLEEVIDETKTLRELKPFKNILKFSKRIKYRGQYHHLKEKVGETMNTFLLSLFINKSQTL